MQADEVSLEKEVVHSVPSPPPSTSHPRRERENLPLLHHTSSLDSSDVRNSVVTMGGAAGGSGGGSMCDSDVLSPRSPIATLAAHFRYL